MSATAASTSPTLAIYRRLAPLPLGKRIFSTAGCLMAPYFSSIRPRFVDLRPGCSVVSMRKRRAVENHIGTVHALAAGNLCELAAGTAMEASLPPGMRWIPKAMEIQYLAKAETDLTARAEVPTEYSGGNCEVPVQVQVTDRNGKEVVHAVIRMWVSPKR